MSDNTQQQENVKRSGDLENGDRIGGIAGETVRERLRERHLPRARRIALHFEERADVGERAFEETNVRRRLHRDAGTGARRRSRRGGRDPRVDRGLQLLQPGAQFAHEHIAHGCVVRCL